MFRSGNAERRLALCVCDGAPSGAALDDLARDLIRGRHNGHGPMCRAEWPDTWLRRPLLHNAIGPLTARRRPTARRGGEPTTDMSGVWSQAVTVLTQPCRVISPTFDDRLLPTSTINSLIYFAKDLHLQSPKLTPTPRWFGSGSY